MFRYMAFLWDTSEPRASATAERLSRLLLAGSPRWRLALHRPGLRVLYADSRPSANDAYVLHGQRGAILGKIFHRQGGDDSARPVTSLGSEATAKIIASGGKHLIDHFWGRYVAFLRTLDDGATRVLRGPLGTLPCFWTAHLRVAICFSWMEDILALGLRSFSVNWDYVAAHLPSIALECRETGLNEVSQVMGGECLEVRGDSATGTFLWRPDQFATEAIEERVNAAAALRQVTRACVRAWESCYERILVRLSGGLDSSVVLHCLSSESPRSDATCLTYFSVGCDGDERKYARTAAVKARRELIERQRDPGLRLERFLDIARTPKPGFYFGNLDTGRSDAEVAKTHRASAVFTGAGGDTLFYQIPTDLPAADYVRHHGLRPALFSIALDAARLGGVSVWTALSTAVRQGLLRRVSRPSIETQQFPLVHPSVVEAAKRNKRFLHPLLMRAAAQPPGKRWQLRCALVPTQYYDVLGMEDDPEYVHPLLSQPLVELCLRIPSYVLTNGGRDRALARQAFAGDLPPEIVRRRSKGGMEEHAKAILLRHREFTRELLLGGQLVRRGLLNRPKIEEALSGRPTAMANPLVDLYTYLSIEAWLHTWSVRKEKAAA